MRQPTFVSGSIELQYGRRSYRDERSQPLCQSFYLVSADSQTIRSRTHPWYVEFFWYRVRVSPSKKVWILYRRHLVYRSPLLLRLLCFRSREV